MFSFSGLRKALSIGMAGSNNEDRLTVKGAASVTINGKSYTGDSIVVVGGEVFVDGVKVDSIASKQGLFNVTVHGDPEVVETVNGDITVHGDADTVITTNGDVQAKTISARVSTVNGDITQGH